MIVHSFALEFFHLTFLYFAWSNRVKIIWCYAKLWWFFPATHFAKWITAITTIRRNVPSYETSCHLNIIWESPRYDSKIPSYPPPPSGELTILPAKFHHNYHASSPSCFFPLTANHQVARMFTPRLVFHLRLVPLSHYPKSCCGKKNQISSSLPPFFCPVQTQRQRAGTSIAKHPIDGQWTEQFLENRFERSVPIYKVLKYRIPEACLAAFPPTFRSTCHHGPVLKRHCPVMAREQGQTGSKNRLQKDWCFVVSLMYF